MTFLVNLTFIVNSVIWKLLESSPNTWSVFADNGHLSFLPTTIDSDSEKNH